MAAEMTELLLLAYFLGFVVSFVYWQTKAERMSVCPDTTNSVILSALWPIGAVAYVIGVLFGLAQRILPRSV
jgi:hypothetical protein